MNEQSPTPQPQAGVHRPPEAEQPAIKHAIHTPKKPKRAGLILGIIGGVLGLMLVIGGVLFYFLYWQNPNVIIADAITRAFQSEKLETTGTMTMNSDDFDMTLTLASLTDGANESADITIGVAAEGFPSDLEFRLSGVYSQDGTLYVRAGGIEKFVNSLLSELISRQMTSIGASEQEMTVEDRAFIEQYAAQVEAQIRQMIDPIIQKVDNQWLRVSEDTLRDDNEVAACMLEVIDRMKTDASLQQELVAAYRRHNFLIIKHEAGTRDGSTGYEMALDGPELKSKLDGFSAAMKDTELAGLIRGCDVADDESDIETDAESVDDQVARKLVIWVDQDARALTGLDLEIQNGDFGSVTKLKFNDRATQSVSVPTDAREADDVIKEIQENFGHYLPQQGPARQLDTRAGIRI